MAMANGSGNVAYTQHSQCYARNALNHFDCRKWRIFSASQLVSGSWRNCGRERKQFQLISDSFIYARHYLSYYYMIRTKVALAHLLCIRTTAANAKDQAKRSRWAWGVPGKSRLSSAGNIDRLGQLLDVITADSHKNQSSRETALEKQKGWRAEKRRTACGGWGWVWKGGLSG